MRAWLAATLLLGTVLAGCVGGESLDPADIETGGATWTAHGITAEDPAGDARERPAALLFACFALPCEQAPSSQGDTVAFPDLIGATVVGEDRQDLVIELGLAQLGPALEGLDRSDGFHRMVGIATCLDTSRGELCLHTRGAHTDQGAALNSMLFILEEDCNEWQACAYQVPTELIPGEPGALRLTVPKAYLTGSDEELQVDGISASARVFVFEPGAPGRHAAATVYQEDDHRHEHLGPLSPAFGQVVDELDLQAVDLHLQAAPLPARTDGTVLEASPGLTWGAKDPQAHDRYDLLSVAFEEDPSALSVTFWLAGWDGFPVTDLHIVALFGAPGTEVYEVGVLKEGGEAYGYVGHCITYPCQGPYAPPGLAHNHQGWQQALPFEASETSLTVTVPWEHLATIGAGDRLSYMQAVTMHADLAVYFGEYGDDTHGDVHAMSFMDHVEGVLPYVFQHGLGHRGGDHVHPHPGGR